MNTPHVREPELPESCLYECRVFHRRETPRRHAFSYRVFYAGVWLHEMPSLSARLRLFSFNRPNLFSFREDDYLPTHTPLHNPSSPEAAAAAEKTRLLAGSLSLSERVARYCADMGLPLGEKPRIYFVSFPRVFGHQFNPVSFYFCHDREGRPRAAVAEVHNTFGEIKAYPLQPSEAKQGQFHGLHVKDFYVSPFMDTQLAFEFRLTLPGSHLSASVVDRREGRPVFHANLEGHRVPLDDARLLRFTVKYPLMTLLVVARIHWQALLLWLKRVPWFAKAADANRQRDLLHPHTSLSKK